MKGGSLTLRFLKDPLAIDPASRFGKVTLVVRRKDDGTWTLLADVGDGKSYQSTRKLKLNVGESAIDSIERTAGLLDAFEWNSGQLHRGSCPGSDGLGEHSATEV
jgi:hypothetical protein